MYFGMQLHVGAAVNSGVAPTVWVAPAGQRHRNRRISSIRSRVEHLFRVVKCQFGYRKVRYKGLANNAAQVFMLIGLTNLYLKRRELPA